MYQSGCEPAVTCVGSYGPYSQTGLICSERRPCSAMTPKTRKKKPPALAV